MYLTITNEGVAKYNYLSHPHYIYRRVVHEKAIGLQ